MLNGSKMWITNGPIASKPAGLSGVELPPALRASMIGVPACQPQMLLLLGAAAGNGSQVAQSHAALLMRFSAGTLIVYAKTQADAGAHGITAFIIERGMKVGP